MWKLLQKTQEQKIIKNNKQSKKKERQNATVEAKE
jgi:hypothetical protein